MKKLLLGGILLAGLFSQAAFAGSSGVKGKGCAISDKGTMVKVRLNGGVIPKRHGAIKEGSKIVRRATFAYDLRRHMARCGGMRVQMIVTDVGQRTTGPIRFDRSAIQANAWAGNGLRNSVVLTGQEARRGKITLQAYYTVLEPNKLTERFTYKHTFNVMIKVIKDGKGDQIEPRTGL